MKNCEKSHILMLSLTVILLIVTPSLSSSVRTTYLYIITNLLIIALGAQAGIFRAFSKPVDHDKKMNLVSSVPHYQKPVSMVPPESAASTEKRVDPKNDEDQRAAPKINEDQRVAPECATKINNGASKLAGKSKSQKITGTVKTERVVRKCPSMPSLFFIGGGETETQVGAYYDSDEDEVEDIHPIQEEDEVVDLTGQELLIKAETFIGNFYKQLKMQREDSWKKIHGMFTKPSNDYYL